MSEAQDLIQSYRKLLRMCADALAPDAPQELRDKVRDALEQFLAGKE